MNQAERPATGGRTLLICTRRSTSPARCLPRRSPACLTPGRQRRNKGAGEDGGHCPPKRREAAAGDKARSPGRRGCEECSRSPYCLGSFVLLLPPRSPTARAEILEAGQTQLC